MAKKLSAGGKPANPYPKRFYIPNDIKVLGSYGKLIAKEMHKMHVKRMTVDVFKIRSKKPL